METCSCMSYFKKNDPSEVANYRPISLLSTIKKAFEKNIHDKHVFNFFKQTNIITALQSGFVPNDSTVSLLPSCTTPFAILWTKTKKYVLFSVK